MKTEEFFAKWPESRLRISNPPFNPQSGPEERRIFVYAAINGREYGDLVHKDHSYEDCLEDISKLAWGDAGGR